jgi:hypothetical protein
VINATYCCLVAFLTLHDKVVMMPPEEEKEWAKEYVEGVTCLEWQNGFLLADGTKFALFQKPGLHGEVWFNKNKDYSIDCQVCEQSPCYHCWLFSLDHQFASMPPNRWLLIGSHWQHTQCIGFPKYLHFQGPWQDIWARWMDVVQLHIYIWDMECHIVQEACQWAAHCRLKNIQLLGLGGKLQATFKTHWI